MMGPPDCEFFFPLAELRRGHRIAEAKGDELHDFPLLPMRQLGPVFQDLSGFIQKISHRVLITIPGPFVPEIRSGDLTVASSRIRSRDLTVAPRSEVRMK
jgi:hypothetical protein